MNDFVILWNDAFVVSRSFRSVEADLASLANARSMALTTGDVAELIGIHSSTVKRWFGGAPLSAGSLERGVSATTGGHRRIPLDLALRVARERGHAVYLHGFDSDAARVWRAVQSLDAADPEPAQRLLIDWLEDGRTRLIGRFLRHVTGVGDAGGAERRAEREESAAGAAAPVDPGILDGVFGGFMRRVGAGWARGELPIRAERAASREVSETIYALLDRTVREEEPTAVVATVEPEQHLLGSLLVRLMLVQRGWRVEHLGTGLPVAEIVATQQAVAASLVCVSFTPPRGPADVRRFVDVAGKLADRCQPYSLVLGGGGTRGVDPGGCEWPFEDPAVLATLAEFGEWLDEHPVAHGSIQASAAAPPATPLSNA